MSILPSLNHSSESSSSPSALPSQSTISNHGLISSLDPLPQSQRSFDSSPPPHHLSGSVSGQMGAAERNASESSQQVKGRERRYDDKSPIDENGGRALHTEDTSKVLAGSSKGRRKPYGTSVSPSNHHNTVSPGPELSSAHPAGKKVQTVSGNHLLNFHYEPIPVSRPQSRAPPPRRQQRRKPYNKDLFIQANYKFVLLDSGNYMADSMDPDKMLSWEDIICLKYSTPFSVQCPICLDNPLCPQITSCGHIFCFPCILQYFSLDDYDLKDECQKKCPLCFTMISTKDLYTIHIESVKQYQVGDKMEFILLTRQKNSFSSSIKNESTSTEMGILDSFSKFTLTSDVELSVREAMLDLDSWIARADSGLVDDIEKLPYVCAAMEQLKRRKVYWNKQHTSNRGDANAKSLEPQPIANAAGTSYCESEFSQRAISRTKNDKSNWVDRRTSLNKGVGKLHESEDQDGSPSSSFNDSKYSQPLCDATKESKDGDSYNFYQAIDGQHLILHPLCMKCLLHHYGGYDRLPNRISGKILQMETVTQSEAMRRRYRFLSHFSLTTIFQLCEIDLVDILPAESLNPFMDEIKNREKQRKRVARKEHKDKLMAEAAGSQFLPMPYYSNDIGSQFLPVTYYSNDAPPNFSLDDFEALGSPALASSSPPTVGERQTFSSVARLGFAAGHDSPALRTDEVETTPKIDVRHESSSSMGWRNTGASFANIASREKNVEPPPMPKTNEVGKKGKKPSRVLLSTAGGRRY